jgi:hypothetical protein
MKVKKNNKVRLKGEYWKVTAVLKDYIFLESLNPLSSEKKHIMLGKTEFEKEATRQEPTSSHD